VSQEITVDYGVNYVTATEFICYISLYTLENTQLSNITEN